jgi:hypothetical protein
MSKLKNLVFCFIFLLLAGCVGGDPEKGGSEAGQGNATSSLAADEISTAEAAFTPLSSILSNEGLPKEIKLTFYADPVRVAPQLFARLSGVVVGRESLALFCLGNASQACRIGEKIGNYELVAVEKDAVFLRKCNAQ